MKNLINLFILLFIGCSYENQNMFQEFIDQDKVIVDLSRYHLNEVPPQIAELKDVENLTIRINDKNDWKTFPPASTWSSIEFKPPFRRLPDEILQLDQLKVLDVSRLDLRTLPSDLQKLKNLEELNLAFNKLIISEEILKLKKLPNLKRLILYGNRLTTAELNLLMKTHPELTIYYHLP